MKSSKNFNIRSTGFDYAKRTQAIPLPLPERSSSKEEDEKGDEKNMIYIRRPTLKKINNRFQK